MAVLKRGEVRALNRNVSCPREQDEPERKLRMAGAYACQRFSLANNRKAPWGKPRSEPDSGNPTVRDRRGAPGNVAMGAGLRPIAKAMDWPPDPKARAPGIYPDPEGKHC